jgi:hypothetical protein
MSLPVLLALIFVPFLSVVSSAPPSTVAEQVACVNVPVRTDSAIHAAFDLIRSIDDTSVRHLHALTLRPVNRGGGSSDLPRLWEWHAEFLGSTKPVEGYTVLIDLAGKASLRRSKRVNRAPRMSRFLSASLLAAQPTWDTQGTPPTTARTAAGHAFAALPTRVSPHLPSENWRIESISLCPYPPDRHAVPDPTAGHWYWVVSLAYRDPDVRGRRGTEARTEHFIVLLDGTVVDP